MRKCSKLKQKQIRELKKVISSKESSGSEIKRSQAITMLNREKKIKDIFEVTDLHRSQIFELRRKYLLKGIKAIEDKSRKNPKELLTKVQREEIIRILKTKNPGNYRYPGDYWSTGILGDLIKRKYKIEYKSRTSYYLIFRQAKFTYHKPGRIYHERDEEEVSKWKRKTKPIIKKAFHDPNTVILTEDEMILSTQTTFQKIWLTKGEYPKIEISNRRDNRSIYGFLNIKTGDQHAYKTKRQNMYITRSILKKIRKIYPHKKLLIIWDGAGWHRGSVAQEYIKKDGNIETMYFPKYSPEQNPQEHVWKEGRSKVTHNRFIDNIDKATDKFVKYLRTTKFHYSLLGFSPVL